MPKHRSDDPSTREEASPSQGRPRVIVWGSPDEPRRGVFRRLADLLRGDDVAAPRGRPRAEPPPAVFRPPVSRRTGDGAPPGVEERVPRLPQLEDLAPPDEGTRPTPSTVENRPLRGVDDAADHGPGPLYRATLQLLPGRLRPLDPDVVREEIRFVRPTGRDAVVTLGWAEGEPPDHVTLNHPSIRDRHARMSFAGRRWRIESLVAEDPVRVNGEVLSAGSAPRELQSGDEVRLGEARFHFVIP